MVERGKNTTLGENRAATLRQAAWWHGRLDDRPDEGELRDFEAWRAADPLHAAAYAEIERTEASVRDMASAPEIMAIRAETADRMAARRRWRGGPRGAIAAGLALALIVGGSLWLSRGAWQADRPSATRQVAELYQTGLGERMEVRLGDGSLVRLNSQSMIRVGFTRDQRRVTLLKGQALFDVAKNPERPFTVAAAGRSVTALGTEFDVRLADHGIRVALIEGAVAVRSGPRLVATMKPKDVLAIDGDRISLSRNADMQRFTAWTDGVAIFNDTPLAAAVEELNRYERRQIVLGDERVGTVRVSGTFAVGRSGEFLKTIRLLFPVRIARETPQEITMVYADRSN